VEETQSRERRVQWWAIARISFLAIACAVVWLRVLGPYSRVSVIGLVAAVVGIFHILKEAFEAALERRMTVEIPMRIAIGAALAIGQFSTGLVIILFVLIAAVFEGLTVACGRTAIKGLLDLLPANATVRRDGSHREILTWELKPGDVVVVKPGSRIPVDGEVIGGNSFVDQSSITGESLRVEKFAGTHVFAGTINQTGVLEVRTIGTGRNTTLGKIIEAVEKDKKTRGPIQRTADRLAGYLVYFTLGCAALTFLITRDLRSTISVIVVAGACGVAAGTPLAILGGIGRAVRLGAIIKGGVHLEVLSRIDTVALDKTGTSINGEEIVVGSDLLLAEKRIELNGFGGSSTGSSEIVVARGGRLLGAVHIVDTVRPEAANAVAQMKEMGLHVVLLTGDAESIAQSVAIQLGIDEVDAELSPEHKVERVRALMHKGRRVAMMGDGVNDAPALMEANVGIAMGSGTDVARESAQIMLLGNDLVKFVETVKIARRCRRIILANFAATLLVDAAGVGLAAFGFLNPLLAAFIHVSSELACILNSARLLPRKK
jgi:Cu+-exporting ATPase